MAGRLRDSARFTEDDPLSVVTASFACQICLHDPDLVVIRSDSGGAQAVAHCSMCKAPTLISLTYGQVARLARCAQELPLRFCD